MTIEALLERIAVALEKSNELRAHQLPESVSVAAGGLAALDKIDKILEEKIAEEQQKTENKPEKKSEKEKPKYDFNKEIRQPFVDLLNATKNRLGPKVATDLAKKLLKEFTGQIVDPLTVKTLPEDKYEAFLEAVNASRVALAEGNLENAEG